ncbi:hypothetical protein ABN028_04860 [Actinopolymorpha sp. B17G11]|uniref:hypothetical protein n=1 Tax=Actinopolymorpha sp. B17G11 TaxID=3160861 RepID=UPI0032E4ADFD
MTIRHAIAESSCASSTSGHHLGDRADVVRGGGELSVLRLHLHGRADVGELFRRCLALPDGGAGRSGDGRVEVAESLRGLVEHRDVGRRPRVPGCTDEGGPLGGGEVRRRGVQAFGGTEEIGEELLRGQLRPEVVEHVVDSGRRAELLADVFDVSGAEQLGAQPRDTLRREVVEDLPDEVAPHPVVLVLAGFQRPRSHTVPRAATDLHRQGVRLFLHDDLEVGVRHPLALAYRGREDVSHPLVALHPFRFGGLVPGRDDAGIQLAHGRQHGLGLAE